MIYLALAALCFAFNLAHYYVGGKLADAERALQDVTAAHWAAVAEALANIDSVVFIAVALDDGVIYRAAAVSFLPACAGAWLGERRSVRENQIQQRLRKKRRQEREAALAAGPPSALP